MRRKISRARASRLARTLASGAGVSPGAGMAADNGDAPPRAQGAGAEERALRSGESGPRAIIPTIGAAQAMMASTGERRMRQLLICDDRLGAPAPAVGQRRIGDNLLVLVRDNNVEQALKFLKKKMQREGIFREMKRRKAYEKPSEKRVREKAEAIRRARKLARKIAICEGLIARPNSNRGRRRPAEPSRRSANADRRRGAWGSGRKQGRVMAGTIRRIEVWVTAHDPTGRLTRTPAARLSGPSRP